MPEHYIMHVDGDSFFAACEVARRPDLRGKPVVVGEERGIASAFTREAKKLGISRGMPIHEIRRQFPEVTILSSHFELYQEYHDNLIRIIEKYVPIVASYSIDECFARLPYMPLDQIESFVRTIKRDVQTSLGSTFSFGIASTKTLAKLASKSGKPDGCVVAIEKNMIETMFKESDIGSVWGIGYRTNERLRSQGVMTVHDFASRPLEEIRKRFAEPIADIWHELHGKRIHSVEPTHGDKKSIQATRMLIRATRDSKVLFSELSRNIEIACAELRALGLYANAFHFFYAHKIGQSTYKHRRWARVSLLNYTNDTHAMLTAVLPMIRLVWKDGYLYKSTGVTLLGLKRKESIQNDLFGDQEAQYRVNGPVTAMDAINRKFGDWSVMYASSLQSVRTRREDSVIRGTHDTYEYGLPLPYMGEVQ